MDKYHPLKSLAPRDIVARAIDSEMKKSGADFVLLDITHKPARFIIDRFPNIYQTCLSYGIDITKEPIPVVPAAHYQCGGVLTDVDGETDIERPLCRRRSGLHRLARRQPSGEQFSAGSARLRASRRGTESLAKPMASRLRKSPPGNPATRTIQMNWSSSRITGTKSAALMWDYVGIVRTNKRLQRARKPHRQSAGGNSGILLGLHCHERSAGAAQYCHGRGIDRCLRLATSGKPRIELQSGLSPAESRLGPERYHLEARRLRFDPLVPVHVN